MSDNKINCAVIGLGVGEQHARTILNHPHANLSAICDLDTEKAKNFLDRYQAKNTKIKLFEEILKDKTIGLVSIASFDDVHFEQVIKCLQNGKHVFVEKPLCQTQEQLKQIYTLWKKTNLALASNLLLRSAPLYMWLEKAITDGELGHIYTIDMDYLYGRIHKITEGWRANIDDYSIMAGGGIHLIDLMLKFLKQKPTRVQSCINKIATANTAFRYHDFHSSIFYFESGVIGRVTANFGCVHKHHHILRIFGTNATFIYDDMGARIHRNRNEEDKAEKIDLAPKPADKGCLLHDFINQISCGNYKKIAEHEFDLMSVVAASDSAINNNQMSDINYII